MPMLNSRHARSPLPRTCRRAVHQPMSSSRSPAISHACSPGPVNSNKIARSRSPFGERRSRLSNNASMVPAGTCFGIDDNHQAACPPTSFARSDPTGGREWRFEAPVPAVPAAVEGGVS